MLFKWPYLNIILRHTTPCVWGRSVRHIPAQLLSHFVVQLNIFLPEASHGSPTLLIGRTPRVVLPQQIRRKHIKMLGLTTSTSTRCPSWISVHVVDAVKHSWQNPATLHFTSAYLPGVLCSLFGQSQHSLSFHRLSG